MRNKRSELNGIYDKYYLSTKSTSLFDYRTRSFWFYHPNDCISCINSTKIVHLMLSQLEALLTKDTCVGKLLKLKANEVSKRLFLVETMKMMKNIRLRLVCLITFYTVRVGRREDWLTTSATSRRVPFTPIV